MIFFYWPASQAVWQSFLLQDAFGLKTDFVWFENYTELFRQGDYYRAMATTAIFSVAVTTLSLSIALLLAVQADKSIKGAGVYKNSPDLALCRRPGNRRRPVALHVPALARAGGAPLAVAGRRLEPAAQRRPRDGAGGAGLHLEADQLQFPVLPRRPAVDPALRDRGRGHRRRAADATLLDHHLPALSPTAFFLLVVNIVYVFFDTFGIIDAMTGGGPAKATETLVYKVFFDGRLGGDLGGSAAQSVILMFMVVGLTAVQFRYIERKVTY